MNRKSRTKLSYKIMYSMNGETKDTTAHVKNIFTLLQNRVTKKMVIPQMELNQIWLN